MALFNHGFDSDCRIMVLFMKTTEEVASILHAVYPQTKDRFEILSIQENLLSMVMRTQVEDLRPGNTISGPSMFTLADCAFYALILGSLDRQVQAVTTNMSINFFRRPTLNDLVAHARILKLGTRLIVGDVLIQSDDVDIAHASCTYALCKPS